jgi:hypothetical protein
MIACPEELSQEHPVGIVVSKVHASTSGDPGHSIIACPELALQLQPVGVSIAEQTSVLDIIVEELLLPPPLSSKSQAPNKTVSPSKITTCFIFSPPSLIYFLEKL